MNLWNNLVISIYEIAVCSNVTCQNDWIISEVLN